LKNKEKAEISNKMNQMLKMLSFWEKEICGRE